MKTVDIIEKLLNQDLKNYPRAVLIEAADKISELQREIIHLETMLDEVGS